MKLRIEVGARCEIREIIGAYENEQAGLGGRFFDELDELMARIREMPLSFPTASDTSRRALLERFPYAVYFRIMDSRKISIVAVLHQRRDPRVIKRRLQS